MKRTIDRLKPVLTAVLVVVLPVLTHFALAHGWPPVWMALLLGLQASVLVIVFAAKLPPLWRGLLALGLGGLAGVVAFHWGHTSLSLSAGLTHAAINIFLFGMFAATLAPGREPLIATFARHIHNGTLPKELEQHARLETRLWCAFFLAQPITSVLLYVFAPLAVWSFFITILNPILPAVMFGAGTIYRRWRYRHLPQTQLRHLVRIGSAWRAASRPAAEAEGG